MVNPKFEHLHTWYDEIKGRTRQIYIKARGRSFIHISLQQQRPLHGVNTQADIHVIAREDICNDERDFM